MSAAKPTIAVVDYGMGNLRSVTKALEHVADGRAHITLTAQPEVVRAADKVVFPGQGAMKDCMAGLLESGLKDAVLEAAANKPFLACAWARNCCWTTAKKATRRRWGCTPARSSAFRMG